MAGLTYFDIILVIFGSLVLLVGVRALVIKRITIRRGWFRRYNETFKGRAAVPLGIGYTVVGAVMLIVSVGIRDFALKFFIVWLVAFPVGAISLYIADSLDTI